ADEIRGDAGAGGLLAAPESEALEEPALGGGEWSELDSRAGRGPPPRGGAGGPAGRGGRGGGGVGRAAVHQPAALPLRAVRRAPGRRIRPSARRARRSRAGRGRAPETAMCSAED